MCYNVVKQRKIYDINDVQARKLVSEMRFLVKLVSLWSETRREKNIKHFLLII